MNTELRNQLKTTLKTEGAKAVKEIAKKNGIEKPAHLGRHVVAQIVVKDALNQVEAETRAMIEDLGLSVALKGKLITVMNSEGEYVAHGHAWGAVALKLKAWKEQD